MAVCDRLDRNTFLRSLVLEVGRNTTYRVCGSLRRVLPKNQTLKTLDLSTSIASEFSLLMLDLFAGMVENTSLTTFRFQLNQPSQHLRHLQAITVRNRLLRVAKTFLSNPRATAAAFLDQLSTFTSHSETYNSSFLQAPPDTEHEETEAHFPALYTIVRGYIPSNLPSLAFTGCTAGSKRGHAELLAGGEDSEYSQEKGQR